MEKSSSQKSLTSRFFVALAARARFALPQQIKEKGGEDAALKRCATQSQESEGRSRQSGIRSQESEVRSQRVGFLIRRRSYPLSPDA